MTPSNRHTASPLHFLRHTGAWLCLLLLASLSLASCGVGSAGQGAVTLRIWYSTDDPTERVWSQQLASRFQTAHPHVRVRLVDYSFEDLNTKLQLALAGGNPPDLAYVTPRGPGIPAYVAAHRLLDLTSAARSHGWAARLRPGLLTGYNRPFAFYGARSGQVVAVPTALAGVGVLYNRDLLSRLGLGGTQAGKAGGVPDSLASFEAALARARAAGYTPIGLGNADGWVGDDWYLTLVNALVGPSALQSEQELSPRFSFRRPAFLRAAAILQAWANQGYFTANFGGLDAQESIDVFFRGHTLFQLVSSSQNSQILQDQRQSGMHVGVFAFPRFGGGGSVMPVSGYEGWVVPGAGHHHGEAIAFIDGLLSSSTARFLLQHGVLPTRPVAASGLSSHVQARLAVPPFPQQYLQALDTAQPGVYLDAAPISNLNATMEANVQLLLQGYEPPAFLVKSLQQVYASHGRGGSTARIDGEF